MIATLAKPDSKKPPLRRLSNNQAQCAFFIYFIVAISSVGNEDTKLLIALCICRKLGFASIATRAQTKKLLYFLKFLISNNINGYSGTT